MRRAVKTAARRAHLALFLPSLAGGGVAQSFLRAASAFLDRGCRVDLVLGRAMGPHRGRVPDGVRIVELPRSRSSVARFHALRLTPGARTALRPVVLPLAAPRILAHLPGLARYLRRERPDALFSAKTHTNLVAIWASRWAGVGHRIVVSERSQLSAEVVASSKWRWRYTAPLVGCVYPLATEILAISQGVADDLAASTGLPRERITTVYNPVVGPDLAERARADPGEPWLAPGAPPVVLGVGRLTPQKQFSTLLDAFARLRAGRALRLIVLGDGAQRPRLEAQVRRLGLQDAVKLPGFVANPFAYMARAAVFALPSAWEGFGNVLVEALACGCPVVSTDCRGNGPREILAGGAFGRLVPVGDPRALAAAIAATLDAERHPQRLRERAAEFSVDRAVDRYLELLLGDASRCTMLEPRPEETPWPEPDPRRETR